MSTPMKKIALLGAVMGSDVLAESNPSFLERAKAVIKKQDGAAFLEVQEGKKEGQGEKEGVQVQITGVGTSAPVPPVEEPRKVQFSDPLHVEHPLPEDHKFQTFKKAVRAEEAQKNLKTVAEEKKEAEAAKQRSDKIEKMKADKEAAIAAHKKEEADFWAKQKPKPK